MRRSPMKLGGAARRDVLRAGLYGLGAGVVGWGATPVAASDADLPAAKGERILVVVELSGANDGLNTVVPYTDDAYYRARPKLGLRPDKLRKLDAQFGLQPTMAGFERLYKDGNLAIVHGVGYDHPSFSHFTSMAYWHTGAPNSGDAFGWLGRLADGMDPKGAANYLVNIEEQESLAVRARNHVPLVFDNPDKFMRGAVFEERDALARLAAARQPHNATEAFLFDVAASAQHAELHVREACAAYRTPVDYGLVRFGLERVAALIAAGFPTRIYYVTFPHNAFDTHVTQADTHARLLTYVSDHVAAFIQDMTRQGRGDDVAVMVFSEFGRRVAENANLGTDHGTAGISFVAGRPVRGGHYGAPPSLTDLDDGNMRYTTDFRRVYATMIQGWMGYRDARSVLKGDFAALEIFPA
ncbi:MAG: DUF1501 domain-containing protein [Alphaproteobacteria bacterium]|nr:DUF1501 domain-containing protein [Alphaproteobacteria bacterium]